jgi:ABC-2 type transport system permease protein
MKNTKASPSVATTILMVAFILSIVTDMNKNLSGLKYITPFKYFEAQKLMYGRCFDSIYVILSLIIKAASVCVNYVFYKKGDINV